jgi:histidyl-tRNA synthetase
MIKALRGMKDTISPMSEKYNYFIKNTTAIVKKYGFEFIETPILEETALFKRSVGESSDIVGKEMYQFMDKGGNDVCLRPEGTAGVVRSFIEHKLDRQGLKQKFFYYGPMFRYERPQKGRFRQFHQFGVESFGEASVLEDVSMIIMIKEILDFFNINYTIKLNSLGCKECMPTYRDELKNRLDELDGLCEDCQRRKETNPIRVFDCKNENCQNLIKDLPRIKDALCDSCKSDFETLLEMLDSLGVEYELDSNLVRGLDYYSKTAFEFVSGDLGAQNAVAGGGRYDRLVEFLDGKPTPAIGFAIGIERLLDMIEAPEIKRDGYYFGAMDEEAIKTLYKEASLYRKDNKVTISYEKKSLKAHLKGADRAMARYCAIIGEDELKNGKLWVKDLEEKREILVDLKVQS